MDLIHKMSAQIIFILLKIRDMKGAWVAQSVECPTLAQGMISQFVVSSPTSGSVLTEPASDSVSPSHALSLKNK